MIGWDRPCDTVYKYILASFSLTLFSIILIFFCKVLYTPSAGIGVDTFPQIPTNISFLLPNWSPANLATFSFCCVFFGKVQSIQHELISCRVTSIFFLLMANFWGSNYLKLEDEKSESFLEDTWLSFLLLRGGGIDKRSPYTNAVNPQSTLLPMPNNVHFLDALPSLYIQWVPAR